MATQLNCNANEVIEIEVQTHGAQLEAALSGDVLFFSGPLIFGIDNVVRDTIERRAVKRDKLCVILETEGGYISVVERIVATLRHHYKRVEFFVPNFAMSAGTVLVMSGDAIHMDYYSVLGPIDPQVERRDGRLMPALGYLVQYERLIKKSARNSLTTAEMTYLVEKFDPAELYRYEQDRELSITLLKEWLVNYKFKNWTKTHTRGKKVTAAMRKMRAAAIAKLLNKTDEWHSHGRGIPMNVLRQRLHLEIEDFSANSAMHETLKTYYGLLVDYMGRLGHEAAIHFLDRYVPVPVGAK
jgi:hypothetical protein